jgi:hypothetical protein
MWRRGIDLGIFNIILYLFENIRKLNQFIK